MKVTCLLLLVAVAGCSAAKQVTFSPPNASPPPPTTYVPTPPGSTPFQTVGLTFSFNVTGFTTNNFVASQQKALCDTIQGVSGWNASLFNCVVGAVNNTDGASVIASGYALYNWEAVPSVTALASATTLRNTLVASLTNNYTSVFANTFAGQTVTPNAACLGPTTIVTKASGTGFSFSNAQIVAGIPGPVQCDARLTYSGTAAAAAVQVGIDNGSTSLSNAGKYCSAVAVNGGVVGTPGTVGPCIQYGVMTTTGTNTAVATIVPNRATAATYGTLDTTTAGGFAASVSISNGGFFYDSAPNVTLSAPNPTAIQTQLLNGVVDTAVAAHTAANNRPLQIIIQNPAANGPYLSYPSVTLTNAADVVGTCTAITAKGIATAAPVTGLCTGSLSFVPADSAAGALVPGVDGATAGMLAGAPAARDTVNGGGGAAFGQFTQNSLGYFTCLAPNFAGANPTIVISCTTSPTYTISTNTLQPAVQATATANLNGGAVTSLTINNVGSGYRTDFPVAATFSAPPPTLAGRLCSTNPITGLNPSIAISRAINPTDFGVGKICQPIGRDTLRNAVCSSPAAPGGILGVLNAGTCNVDNAFIPQPLSTTQGSTPILPQSFTTYIATNGSAAAPAPAPTKAPTPAPTTAPAPSPPTTASFRGRFQISSVACKGKFLSASASCGDRLVYLRTTSQSKGSRTFWAIDGTAGVATGVTSVVRIGKCNGNTNLASAQSTPTPVIGGGSWKVILTPVDAANPNVVTIQATDKTYKGKFLQVGDKCDDQKGFTWGDKSASTGQQWTVTSVTNVQ